MLFAFFLIEAVVGCDVAVSMQLRAFEGKGSSKEIWLGPFANREDDKEDGDYDWTLSALHTFRFSVNRERDSAKLGVSRLPRAPSPDLDYRRDLEAKIRTACRGSTRLRGFQVSLAAQSAGSGKSATVSLSELALNVSMEMFPLAFESTLTSVNSMSISPVAVFLDVPPGNEDKSFQLEGTLSLSGRFEESDESSRVQIDACCEPAPTQAMPTASATVLTSTLTSSPSATMPTKPATALTSSLTSLPSPSTPLTSAAGRKKDSAVADSDWQLPMGLGVAAFVLALVVGAILLLLLRRRRQANEAVPVGNAMSPLPTPSTGEYERVSSLLPESSYQDQTLPAVRHEYDAPDSPLD
jgi:hypothetical protein